MKKQSVEPDGRQSSTWKAWSVGVIVLAVGIAAGSLYWSGGIQKEASPGPGADVVQTDHNQEQEKHDEPVKQKSDDPSTNQSDTGQSSGTEAASNETSSSSAHQTENQGTEESASQKNDLQAKGQTDPSQSNSAAPATGASSSAASNSGLFSSGNRLPSSVTDTEKNAVIAQHREKLTALKSNCKSNVNKLIGQAKQSMKQAQIDGDKDAASSVQKKLLISVIGAESSCESQFNEIVANARSEFQEKDISAGVIDAWKQEYDQTRQDSYKEAMEELKSMFN
ncbi:hypothetical protein ACFOQM_09985 [Paenibacillus sp. GCM10012307]|uniref:Uncharacterized protein n=1 Tax=Paenibacillus roseus TaxID=2798579 RepID=A0A934MP24_9BACL|nr:hypothetical protein [Paenibacillus roseus]MBJ6361616.1 hypothetical protein [Paenibacillus roseus]